MSSSNAFEAAERLAPVPTNRDHDMRSTLVPMWDSHFAALALAAHAAFREELERLPSSPEPDSRPELGYLMLIATSATAAVIALGRPEHVSDMLWDYAPECGALNGEDIDYLADVLDRYGINPADIYRWFDPSDFESVSHVQR